MNLFEIFEKYDENLGGTLDMKEFTKMIKIVANGLKSYEIEAIFDKFDTNKDKNIDFKEFVKVMTFGLSNNIKEFDFSEEKARKVVSEFRRIVIDNRLNTELIFSKFDVDFDNLLSRREFRDLIRVIDSRISNEEINFVFDIFDIDSQDFISLENFILTLENKHHSK